MNNKHLPHGLASIVAVLKEFDHKVNFLYFETRVSKKELLEKLSHFRFDLIGISATTSQWYIVKKYPGWIKTKYRGVKIIFGGTHPTVCPSEVMAVKGVDMVCVGEGELPMLNLCNAMEKGHDYSGIESLWIKRRGFGLSKIIKNKVMHLVKDLDTFPLPDREFF
ncbi:MAG: cobalamin-dependent protein, partial [Thermodesulfobacteriota bacterium]|nr:cobalamin-dependent protein [Thermodesulfobacteriota bacterium]